MLQVLLALLLIPFVAFAQPIPGSSSPSGGMSLTGPNVSGRAYLPPAATAPTGSALGAANRLYAEPFFAGAGSTLKSLSFNISTGNAAAWNARMCVYADNGSGAPGALIPNGDTGTIAIGSGSVTGTQTATVNGSTGIPVSGWVWLAFMADSNSESLMSYTGSIGALSSVITSLLGATNANSVFSSVAVTGVFMAQTFGACPGSFGAVSYINGASTPFLVATF